MQTFSYIMLIKCHEDRKTIIAISKLFRWLFPTFLPTPETLKYLKVSCLQLLVPLSLATFWERVGYKGCLIHNLSTAVKCGYFKTAFQPPDEALGPGAATTTQPQETGSNSRGLEWVIYCASLTLRLLKNSTGPVTCTLSSS